MVHQEALAAEQTRGVGTASGAHTPGPWGWFGDAKHGNFYLATIHGGRRFVMGFRRCGMRNAQPTFQIKGRMVEGKDLAIYEVCPEATSGDDPRVYRHDIIGFRSADARLIVAAPDLAHSLKNTCDALEFCLNGMSEADPFKTKVSVTLKSGRAALALASGPTP